MHCQLTPVVVIAMFEYINPLPCSQHKTAALNRNDKLGLSQGGLDVRGHVVGPLAGMPIRTIPGCDTGEKIVQITAYIGIGIFLDGERGGSVTHKQGKQAFINPLLPAPISYLAGDVIQARTVCFRAQSVRYLPHRVRVTKVLDTHYLIYGHKPE